MKNFMAIGNFDTVPLMVWLAVTPVVFTLATVR